jgi:tripartite-type tricarboxylate transporter receptor subunit TctC
MKKLIISLLMLPAMAFAWQPNPKQSITLLLPTSPGSGGELTARIIAKHIEQQGLANFSIEHKAGADGNIMLKELLESKPDGYTVGIPSCVSGFLFSDSHFTNLIKRSPLDLSLVTNIGKSPMAFVANKDSKVNTFQQLISEVKSGKDINFAVGGSAHYLTFEYFTQNLKVDKTKVIPVVFKGPVPASMSVAQYDGKTGTEYGIMPIAPALPLVQSGKIKLLALAGEKKLKGMENVPLAKDFVPGLNMYGCWNFALPPNTPSEIVEWYTKHVVAALNTPEYKKFMEENYIFLDKKSVGPENILKEMVEFRKTWKPYVESLPKPN